MKKQLSVENLTKWFSAESPALDDIGFEIGKGEFVAVIGPSGAGKSTLLRCINRIVEPTSGKVYFEGSEISRLRGRKIREARRHIGMIFQQYNLVNRLTVFQNVLHGRLGYMTTAEGVFSLYKEQDKLEALKLLEKVGLSEYIYKRAGELSGGQKQRVGIVRALMQSPTLLLCDEPIASLDPGNSKIIMELIRGLASESGITCLVNLHQVHVAREYATRIIGIRKGKLVFDGLPSDLDVQTIENIYDSSMANLMLNGEAEAIG